MSRLSGTFIASQSGRILEQILNIMYAYIKVSISTFTATRYMVSWVFDNVLSVTMLDCSLTKVLH